MVLRVRVRPRLGSGDGANVLRVLGPHRFLQIRCSCRIWFVSLYLGILGVYPEHVRSLSAVRTSRWKLSRCPLFHGSKLRSFDAVLHN